MAIINMQRPRRLRRQRSGMAPLELVLGLPFLLFLVASIWSIGRVGLGKQAAEIQARQYTWKQRMEPDRRSPDLASQSFPNPDSPLSVFSGINPGSGIFNGETKQDVSVPRWLGSRARPEGKTSLTVHTWSHHQVDMSSSRPHFHLLVKMGQPSGGVTRAFNKIFNLGK